LLSVDLDGSESYYHGVPSDFETSCSVECSWHIVEMWESCGNILYFDSVGHGINPPSDPSDMMTFYETCLPVYQGNPPPPPPPNPFGDGAAADIITSANSDRTSGGEEDAATGTMYLGSSDLELPFDGDTEQIIAVVFQGVDADASTGVTGASILFDVDEVRDMSAEDVTMSIYGELNASPSLPSLADNDISSRTATEASVEWSPPASQVVHEDLVTPDLMPIVNEIFALPGWSAGSDMCIMFSWISGTGSRWVENASTNNDIDTPALLLTQPGMSCGGGTILTSANSDRTSGGEQDIETGTMYLGSSDLELMHDNTEQIVAVVFQGVEADASTGVVEASILFDIDEVNAESADPVSINIYGELNANPALPSSNANDLSSRAQTEATVEWSPPASNVVHEELTTPNIISIVDEIFALPDWSGGNDMCIMFSHISGSGVRWVENASTNNGIDTPALLLTYL
jgi:hypothetical protein